MIGNPRTVVQKLSDLIEWYLADREIELRFIPNVRRIGRLAPEFDFVFLMNGRRITERCLAMSIQSELARMNYDFSLGKTIGALTDISWRHYLSNQEYPEWLKNELPEKVKRPVGRPRLHPPKIPFDGAESVNTLPNPEE